MGQFRFMRSWDARCESTTLLKSLIRTEKLLIKNYEEKCTILKSEIRTIEKNSIQKILEAKIIFLKSRVRDATLVLISRGKIDYKPFL